MTLDEMAQFDHEQVSYFHDEKTGLNAIIAIYDTSLGPALGGTRVWDYDTEDEALNDALRLSKGMAYKAAAADLDLGGGKAVIWGEAEEVKSDELFRMYGRTVESLNGRYITAEDVNTEVDDMEIVNQETDHVTGLASGLGDPSPVTAHGIKAGMKACLKEKYGSDSLDGIDVVVQGAGKVGSALIKELVDEGADVVVSDIDAERVAALQEKFGIESIEPDDVYSADCDVFAPCALGGVINDDTIPRLNCDIVAGSANNVLGERRHAAQLKEEDILYAPDYVINAGGLITVVKEKHGKSKDDAYQEAAKIGSRMERFIEQAQQDDSTVVKAADRYAEQRMEAKDGPRFTTLSS